MCGPQGELVAPAGDQEEILLAEISPMRSERVRRLWPFLRDRRIDDYLNLLKRYDDQ